MLIYRGKVLLFPGQYFFASAFFSWWCLVLLMFSSLWLSFLWPFVEFAVFVDSPCGIFSRTNFNGRTTSHDWYWLVTIIRDTCFTMNDHFRFPAIVRTSLLGIDLLFKLIYNLKIYDNKATRLSHMIVLRGHVILYQGRNIDLTLVDF